MRAYLMTGDGVLRRFFEPQDAAALERQGLLQFCSTCTEDQRFVVQVFHGGDEADVCATCFQPFADTEPECPYCRRARVAALFFTPRPQESHS